MQTSDAFGGAGSDAISGAGIVGAIITFFAAIGDAVAAVWGGLAGIETSALTVCGGFVGFAVIAFFAVSGIDNAVAAIGCPLAFGCAFVFWCFAVGIMVLGTLVTGFTGLNIAVATPREFARLRALAIVIVVGSAVAFLIMVGLDNAVAAVLGFAAGCTAIRDALESAGIADGTADDITFFARIEAIVAAGREFGGAGRFAGIQEAVERELVV